MMYTHVHKHRNRIDIFVFSRNIGNFAVDWEINPWLIFK